jgi:excinuclease ABC subunit A
MTDLVVRGAREHNLRAVDLVVPRNALVVFTGPSGSGKTSLAFDVVYAEAQRRYVEGLGTYARQLFARLPRPDVDFVDGLSPALSVEQREPVRNPRSTVGTLTEVYDYARLLYATLGVPHGPTGEAGVPGRTVDQMVDEALALPPGTRISVLAPVLRDSPDGAEELLARLKKEGFVRVRVDGVVRELDEVTSLAAGVRHRLDVVVDRLTVDERSRSRLGEAIELSLGLAGGRVIVLPASGEPLELAERFVVPGYEGTFPPLTPALFSFNGRLGACATCDGLGEVRDFDADLVVTDPKRTLREGAIAPWGKPGGALHVRMIEAARSSGLPVDAPLESLSPQDRGRLLEGDAGLPRGRGKRAKVTPFEGVLPSLRRRLREHERRKREQGVDEERTFAFLEEELGGYMRRATCPACEGERLRLEARLVRVAGKTLPEVGRMTIDEARAFLRGVVSPRPREKAARRILDELDRRLAFLLDTGLAYLSLGRAANSLSGGETQRVRLASQLGAGLTGVLYVLDEPTSGLHPADTSSLLDTLESLRDRGNSLLVVEHEPLAMERADHLVDMGPGAGRLGGRVVASGTLAEVVANPASVTGPYLSGARSVPIPGSRRLPAGPPIRIEGASAHNLRDVTVEIPVSVLTCVTGVSGSGKSSLVMHTLVPEAERALLGRAHAPAARHVSGLGRFDKLIHIDQSPLGRSSRSNPATAVGAMQELRNIFAELPEARARGYKAGRFSFNVKGGRCEACRGEGVTRLEMHFLPDVFVECEVCGGKRFDRETLEVRYRGYSIADVLALPVADAIALFDAFPRIASRLTPLARVGLGYLELGRSAMTLSAGEAQRVKLARELGPRSVRASSRGGPVAARVLYVLDEPTRGLHFVDVDALVEALHALVDAGNTVVVVEHHADVVKSADWVIDLGPGGGPHGGLVVGTGTPEAIAANPASKTGHHLGPVLARGAQ